MIASSAIDLLVAAPIDRVVRDKIEIALSRILILRPQGNNLERV